MSDQAPLTEVEAVALNRALPTGVALTADVLAAYRAGVRDGSKPFEPRVLRALDDLIGCDYAVDKDGDLWTRISGTVAWLMLTASSLEKSPRDLVDFFGPLVTVDVPPYEDVIADEERRRGDAG